MATKKRVCPFTTSSHFIQSQNYSSKTNKKEIYVAKLLSIADMKTIQKVADRYKKENKRTAIIDWFVVQLGLYTGMRAFEMAKLHPRDVHINAPLPYIEVEGKGKTVRKIYISEKFKQIYLEYLNWKQQWKEDITAYIFFNPKTDKHYTSRALQKSFKRTLKRAGISHYGLHSMRHTYATQLDLASQNIGFRDKKLVQSQLGHRYEITTEHYLHSLATQEKVKSALDNMYTQF